MRGFSKFAVLVMCVLATACGSSDDENAGGSAVEGLWQVTLANGCVGTYSFKGAAYSSNYLCQLTNGNYGAEVLNGTFSIHGSEIDFLPNAASCVAHSAAETDPYSVQGQNLSLTFGSSLVIFQKAMAGTVNGGALIETGCWDFSVDPGAFTPHAVQNL
ncbi:MAG: hypothetical protein ABUL62_19365 [Myxococcales bacterium]